MKRLPELLLGVNCLLGCVEESPYGSDEVVACSRSVIAQRVHEMCAAEPDLVAALVLMFRGLEPVDGILHAEEYEERPQLCDKPLDFEVEADLCLLRKVY